MKKLLLVLVLLLHPSWVVGQGLPIKGGATTDLAGVDTNKNLQVNPPTTASQSGFVALCGRNDAGAVTGTARCNIVYVTEGQRLATTLPTLWWNDTFNATAQNTSNYRCPITTMTCTFTGGFVNINGGTITTANTNAALQTYRTFPLFAKSEVRLNISGFLTAAPQANAVIEMGLLNATLPGAAAPSDGVFWRWNAAGELRGVINYNGTETQTAAITTPSANVVHDFVIVIQTNTVLFWIDDVLQRTITLLTDAPAQGNPISQQAAPITFRQYIGATPPAVGNQLRISNVFVTELGAVPNRDWESQAAGFGQMASQGQNGGTLGTTALYANNANPGTAVPTNTTAALGSGLGGKFQETLTLAAGTDGIISSFQVPAGSVTQTARNLVVRGVCIQGVVTVALTTNPLTTTMSVAYGHTAVSLATAEAVTGTKAPRRIAVGAYSVASATAAGTPVVGGGCFPFTAPIVVAPGEFFATTTNKITVAPATGSIMWSITVDAYFE
jgi:hypothetical protein